MSHLRFFISTAIRQYHCLTVKRLLGPAAAQSAGLYTSPRLADDSDESTFTEEGLQKVLNLMKTKPVDKTAETNIIEEKNTVEVGPTDSQAAETETKGTEYVEVPSVTDTTPQSKIERQIEPGLRVGGEFFVLPGDLSKINVGGVPFGHLPEVYIKSTRQNTIASAHLSGNKCLSYQSGGVVGFKNANKKTNVCGQTVGLAVGMDLMKKGYKDVHVFVKGNGAGRLPAIKGLCVAGLNVVTITDRSNPDVSHRPKKVRRI